MIVREGEVRYDPQDFNDAVLVIYGDDGHGTPLEPIARLAMVGCKNRRDLMMMARAMLNSRGKNVEFTLRACPKHRCPECGQVIRP